MVRAGDKLAFFVQGIYGQHWEVHKVDSITRCGLVRCGRYLLTMDLDVRGRFAGLRAERATVEIEAAAEAYQQRVKAVDRLRQVNFAELTDSQLKSVMEIVTMSQGC